MERSSRICRIGCLLVVLIACARPTPAAKITPLSSTARMPVEEVTVFKDGHAFVLHEGEMPTDDSGDVLLDYLPRPVIGTFWPYSAQPGVKLGAVTAGRRSVLIKQTALTVKELIEANTGAEAFISETTGGAEYLARIVGIPRRSTEELEATGPVGADEKLPVKSEAVMLETGKGFRMVPIKNIRELTFKEKPNQKVSRQEFRNYLTLDMDWDGKRHEETVRAGLVYLQRGIRWIPHYSVNIEEDGKARVQLRATLLNELADLDDVTVNLVIGVPTFAFKDTVDPISLQQTVARLSQQFQDQQQTAYAFSNAIMTQHARMGEHRGRPVRNEGVNLGPDITGGGKHEDLFVFTLDHVSLAKGERMSVSVSEFTLEYTDVYTLDIDMAPPPEMRRHFNNKQRAELAKLFYAPKAMHKLRLVNTSEAPLTTAPTVILKDNRLMAQGMMTYTAVGASTDLKLTTAIDIQVKKSDAETKRTPNAMNWSNHSFNRIDLAGSIGVTNHRDKKVRIEVTRRVLGNADSADKDGKASSLNAFEESAHPYWWRWCNWPYWWSHINGIGSISWEIELEPGEDTELNYTWHYFWRY